MDDGSVVILVLGLMMVVWLAHKYLAFCQQRAAWKALSFDERVERDHNQRDRATKEELTDRLHDAATEILQIPHGFFENHNSAVIKDAGIQKVVAAEGVEIYTTPLVEVEGQLFMLERGRSSWGLERVKVWVDSEGIQRYRALPGVIYHLGDLWEAKKS